MARTKVHWQIRTAAALAIGCLLAGCGASGSDEAAERGPQATTTSATQERSTTTAPERTTTTAEEGRGDVIPDEPEPQPSGPATEFTTISDPANGAFSVDVPVGWDNLAYSTVDGQIHREVVNSVSPDGKTVVFLGDPKIPSYWEPATADDITRQFAEWLPTMDLAPYTPAPQYYEDYVHRKFGGLPGFSLDRVERNTAVEESGRRQFAEAGVPIAALDAANVSFSYTDADGTPIQALVSGQTVGGDGFWNTDVVGLATDGTVEDYLPMVQAIAKSKQTSQAFIDGQNQRHQQTMAMIQERTEAMTRQHQANMAWIQDSANAHQQRMESIWAANDASVAGFYDRMAAGDVDQRQFLNSINDESTVQSSGGQKFQVDSSYQRYWVDPTTGRYAGGDINFGESQLRELGLDPSAYEEVQIVRG